MATRYALNDVPDRHMLACAAKLVAMMIQARDEDDAFTCLFAIQAASRSSPHKPQHQSSKPLRNPCAP